MGGASQAIQSRAVHVGVASQETQQQAVHEGAASEGTQLRVLRTDDHDVADVAAAQHPEYPHPHEEQEHVEWRRPLDGTP